jgi:hypothetical protein
MNAAAGSKALRLGAVNLTAPCKLVPLRREVCQLCVDREILPNAAA